MASLDELVIAGVVAAIVAPDGDIGRRLTWLGGPQAVRVGSMLCSASLFATLLGGHH